MASRETFELLATLPAAVRQNVSILADSIHELQVWELTEIIDMKG